ncbi:MAG: glycosyl transferase family 1 [Sphingomonadaceae bacterium PASS1]|nr:MAG: glycosyl transferase family 1 [Sphingomonadaceae bacterium PASS1]
MAKKILALTRYELMGASSRVRFALYKPALDTAGYHIEFSPFFDDDYLQRLYRGEGKRPFVKVLQAYSRRLAALFSARGYDILWIEKELFPFAPPIMERLIAMTGVPYVVDFDDAIFHNYDQHSSFLVRKLLSNRLDILLAHSSGVTAGNRYLGNYARQHGARNVVDFPTVVDTPKYEHLPADDCERPLTLGWIGSPATRHLLVNVISALDKAAILTPFRLLTIGIPALENTRFPVEAHPWTEDSEVTLLNKIDIGIMPLADTPFERGKCGYKLIQYMACGKPVIASPVGVNREIVTPDVGFLARTDLDWSRAISTLGGSRHLRERMGVSGRSKVEQFYSLASNIPRLTAFFDAISDNHTIDR